MLLVPFVFSTLTSLDGPLLMRHPSASKTQVVFSFAGDLWSVPIAGGDASRITNSPGQELNPYVSPDGTMVAFTGEYGGNNDVYVMPIGGGEPKRLTFQPGVDIAVGWTPDSKGVVFTSDLGASTDLALLYTVPITGGVPTQLPLPSGSQACYSPNGAKLAYAPGFKWQQAWKRYRGGQTSPIWIADLSDSRVKEVPRKNSNDTDPVFVGDNVYFLSDRNGPVTLFRYEVNSGKVTQCLKNEGFDRKSATAGPGGIAIEHLGEIELFDPASGEAHTIPVRIAGDFPEPRPQYKQPAPTGGAISPNGVRALFEARGDIFTVPVSKGDARNLTQSSASMERFPAWSPDGQSICYFSDESGEYKLVVRDAAGKGSPKTFEVGEGPAYYYLPVWSPDSSKVAYSDNKHNLWYLDIKSGKSTKVDTNPYENPTYVITANWSPDSKWVTYHRDLDSHLSAVFVYSLDSGKSTQVTNSLADAKYPVFDLGGKYLYFTASTNSGPAEAWLDLSSYRSINIVSSVYVAVLRSDTPSPLAPESDEEKPKSTEPAKPDEKKDEFRIDFDGLGQRILALPLPGKNYTFLAAGPAGSVLVEDVAPLALVTSPPRTSLTKFSLADKSSTSVTSNFQGIAVSSNGEKALVQHGPSWSIISTAAPETPGQGALDMSGLTVKVDPVQEWRQMFHEVWRIQRDFFYDPHYHGLDLKATEKKYEPFLQGIRSRADLNYLFTDMLGEICVGHMFIFGGDIPGVQGVPGGMLGADFTLENGRYRLGRVYDGENWNPGLIAPLTQPGVSAKAGEYLTAINGIELSAEQNIYERLEGTVGKQVSIHLSPNPDGKGGRDVTVVPIASESGLRGKAWEEDNLRLVEKLSGGKIGYMHIPDTNIGGWTNFNRYFYAQVGKQGIIIDERFNHGGQVDDFMVDQLARPLRSMWTTRDGKDFASPLGAVFGPKVMLINQYSGSGGDYFPWHFRQAKLGPIVGKRTWGGLVGILNFPPLMDGGGVTSPNLAFYNPNGTWDVENHGVDPDIEVDIDPYLWRQGHDPQLERAVEEALKALAKTQAPSVKKPAYVDKTKIRP